MKRPILTLAAAGLIAAAGSAWAAPGPTDPQIAHIAYTAGAIDVAAGKQALAKSHNPKVRDHSAVNDKALALVKKLGVTPQPNPTSAALQKQADAERGKLARLSGRAFDRAYAANEVAYHKTVNGALEQTLIPSAHNGELKSLLGTGLKLFEEHQAHAEQLTASLR